VELKKKKAGKGGGSGSGGGGAVRTTGRATGGWSTAAPARGNGASRGGTSGVKKVTNAFAMMMDSDSDSD
jgi:hypothetical protein